MSTIDGQVAAVSKRVSKQFGRWVSYGHTEAPIERAAKAGKAAASGSAAGFTAEQRAEVSERMKNNWAKRRKSDAKDYSRP